MATKKTGILSAIIDSFPAPDAAPAPAPAADVTLEEENELQQEREFVVLRTNALKEVGLALGSDATAVAYWKSAAQGFSLLYEDHEDMMRDEKLKNAFFGLVAEKFGFSDVLATKVARGCDTPEALATKKQKAAARATQATYWTRLLNYSFPPARGKKTPSHGDGGADEADAEGENEAPKGPAKSAFEGLVDKLSSVIKGLETLEDAPERANITQALKHLGIARAHLRGI